MRYAIISDIHSNFQALEAVLELVGRLEVEQVICLGDIVGYGADPSPCIARVRQECSSVIKGNHDAAAVGETSVETFNLAARWAADWTQERLDQSELDYLRQLPMRA
ncbi:MAG: metallophosphoesterase family protein, partial [Gemmatimonadota bacterium]|nr:metallophosphoesterase family protein [Gemmatimonadota bacterium]